MNRDNSMTGYPDGCSGPPLEEDSCTCKCYLDELPQHHSECECECEDCEQTE